MIKLYPLEAFLPGISYKFKIGGFYPLTVVDNIYPLIDFAFDLIFAGDIHRFKMFTGSLSGVPFLHPIVSTDFLAEDSKYR